ncbi:MAG: DUF938 domain-containing protein [Methyloligellaceae bacterium]
MTGKDERGRGSDPAHYRAAIEGSTGDDARHYAPAAERNTAPILSVLKAHLPRRGRVLEVASGSGQHVVAFAQAFPDIEWLPSDPVQEARESIVAWTQASRLDNIRPPLALDMLDAEWSAQVGQPVDAIIAINLVHIAPWEAAGGLFGGAAKLLGAGGLVYLYGPFRRSGGHTAPSNAAFDRWLKEQNPAWGVRDMEAVAAAAEDAGFSLLESVAMPANNFSLLFRRRS